MVVTVERVSAEIMKLSDIAGNRCYSTPEQMRKHYGLQAIANACSERSVEPAQTSQEFWNIVSRHSY